MRSHRPGLSREVSSSNERFVSLKDYGYVHLSAGDLLREEAAKPDSALGKEINEHIKNGSIVPVAVTCKLLENVGEDLRPPTRASERDVRLGNAQEWQVELSHRWIPAKQR